MNLRDVIQNLINLKKDVIVQCVKNQGMGGCRMIKTKGQCLTNNWNNINNSTKEERVVRIEFQNRFATTGEFDIKFYMKHFWK